MNHFKATKNSFLFILAFVMMVGMGSAGFVDDFNKFWQDTAPEVQEDLCSSFVGWTQSTCLPYKLDGGFVDGAVDTVHTDIYSDTLFWKDGRKTINKEARSHLNQSFGMSIAQAKIDIIREYNNGSSESVAQQKGNAEVNDFYTMQQERVYNWKDREVLKFNRSLDSIDSTDGLLFSEVYNFSDWSNTPCTDARDAVADSGKVNNGSVTLANGTEIETYSVVVTAENVCADNVDMDETIIPVDLTNSGNKLSSKSTNGTINTALNAQSYSQTLTKVENTRTRAIDNVNGIANDFYKNLEQDKYSVSDLTGPLEQLYLASTNYEDTGYYSYRATSLQQAGYASNDSYAFSLKVDNQGVDAFNATGQLFVVKEDFNKSAIETGETYDMSDVRSWFVHSTDGGKAKETTLNGTITVNELTNPDTGEKINSTSLQSTKFYTRDTDNLEKQLENLREEIEELQGTGLFGGDVSSWFDKYIPDFGLQNQLIIVLIVVILLMGLYIA